ncbi:hypothetical protein [Natrialba chahannaoensis]|uniref:hypothetical protein n=1 Tax=Natrialba chahannaoensis TaxID=68911 RepID=UPI000AFF115E|nr:hypothetical protein [Natrialba chahannaoensis]
MDFGEFCVGDEECAELDLSVGLGGLLPGFDDFELAEVDIVGDTGVFNVDADLENGELSLVAEFCPTFPGDFEATAVVTVEDPIGLLEATVCVDLFGTGIECEPNFEVKWLTPTTQ